MIEVQAGRFLLSPLASDSVWFYYGTAKIFIFEQLAWFLVSYA